MDISPDQWILLEWHGWQLNATVAFTWLVMFLLTFGSWVVTSLVSQSLRVSRWQIMLEVIVTGKLR